MSGNDTAQAEMVLRNKELEEERYQDQRRFAGFLISALGVCVIAIAFLIWLAFFHFPITNSVATSNAAAVCNIAPVAEPFIEHQVVADFAAEAATGIYTYDHANYRRQITDVTNKYFTASYRDQFLSAFGDSVGLKTVLENFYVVKATTAGRPPQIVKNGLRNGTYFWTVQVPLTVYYISGRRQQENHLLAEVVVSRTPPTRINPRGIAVSDINVNQLIN